MKCASFYAGIGGIDLAFQNAGFDIIYATDISDTCKKTYEENFSVPFVTQDIREIDLSTIPQFDILLAGFSGTLKNKNETNNENEINDGTLFQELKPIIKARKPKIIFLENSRYIETHDEGIIFNRVVNFLKEENYFVKSHTMNTKSYGNLPQNRERTYILAFLEKETYEKFEFPKIIKRVKTLNSVISFNEKVNDKYYYTDENFKDYEILNKNVTTNKTLYQYRRGTVRENKSGLCPTLTSHSGKGGHNIPIILAKHGIRRLTPRECFNLQGFPKTFKFPKHMADSYLYRQAGNTVSVTVVERIAKYLKKVL